MSAQPWRNNFLVRTWEHFNEFMGAPSTLWFDNGWWSDRALLIREDAMPVRAYAPTIRYGRLVVAGPKGQPGQYGRLLEHATSLLPCSLPAVSCYLYQNREPHNGAIVEDQLGHRAYLKYGYLSLLRTMCPQVVIRVVPRRAFPRLVDGKVLLCDQAGALVGMLMQVDGFLRVVDGIDGPLPTGLEPVDQITARRAQKAVKQIRAQRAMEAARG